MHACLYAQCSFDFSLKLLCILVTTFSTMDIYRRSSRLFFNGFRGYSSKKRIQESNSRARLHSFSSRRGRPILGEFWVKNPQRKSSFLDGAKNFYCSMESNNEVYLSAGSRVWRWKQWAWKVENTVAMALFSGGVAFVVFFGKWETLPYTKSNHLVISPASILEFLGERRCERLKKELRNVVVHPLDPNCVRVRNIAGNLMEGFRRRTMDQEKRLQRWEVVLLNVPRPSGSYPGGKVAISSVLLYALGEDAELATYIARQLGHSVGRHLERVMMLKLMLAIFLFIPHIIFLFIPHLFMMHAPNFNSMPRLLKFLQFPFTRSVVCGITWRLLNNFYNIKFERDADYIGLLFVASAGYDPWVALKLRETIAELKGNTWWENIRTKLLAVDMIEALAIYEEVQASSTNLNLLSNLLGIECQI